MSAYVQLPSGTVLETDRTDLWPEAKRLTAKAGKAALLAESRAALLPMLTPDASGKKTVHTILTHCARSGMSRSIRLVVCGPDGPHDITHHAARLIGAKIDEKHGGLKMGGCGSDMGFEAVYALGYALFPNGTPEPHSKRNGEPDRDGGYAITHRWM